MTLPRPMGVILEEDAGRGCAIVAGFAPKSEAERLNKVKLYMRTRGLSGAMNSTV